MKSLARSLARSALSVGKFEKRVVESRTRTRGSVLLITRIEALLQNDSVAELEINIKDIKISKLLLP